MAALAALTILQPLAIPWIRQPTEGFISEARKLPSATIVRDNDIYHGRRRISQTLLPVLKIIKFKPPVGAVLSLQLYRRLRRKSILEDAASFFPTSWSRSRSLDLDSGDREYALSGGVHHVRVELYRAALEAAAKNGESNGRSGDQTMISPPSPSTLYAEALMEALSLSCGPGDS